MVDFIFRTYSFHHFDALFFEIIIKYYLMSCKTLFETLAKSILNNGLKEIDGHFILR